MGYEGFLPLSHIPRRRLVGFKPLPTWLAPKVLTIEPRAEPHTLSYLYIISISPTFYLFEKQYSLTLLFILSLLYLNILSLFFYKFKYYIFYSFSLLIFLLRQPTPPSKTQQQPPLHQAANSKPNIQIDIRV